jgi:hypothetical protein
MPVPFPGVTVGASRLWLGGPDGLTGWSPDEIVP